MRLLPTLYVCLAAGIVHPVHAAGLPQAPGAKFLMIGGRNDEAHAKKVKNGLANGDIMLVTTSRDGDDFKPLNPEGPWELSPPQNMMRDHTLIRYVDANGHATWVSAFTTEKLVNGMTTFGMAQSDDLIHWRVLPDVTPRFPEKTLHVWSPFIFQDPATKKVYVFVTLDTPTAWQGIGTMECLDPGTWTKWTDWKPFGPLLADRAMYNGGAIYALNGKYYFLYDDASRKTGYNAQEAIITSSASPLTGYGPPTFIPSLRSTLCIDGHFNPKPAKQYRYEGMSLVWMHDHVWRIYDQEFGRPIGPLVNDVMGFAESDDDLATWGPFQFVGDKNSNVGDFIASHIYRLDSFFPKP